MKRKLKEKKTKKRKQNKTKTTKNGCQYGDLFAVLTRFALVIDAELSRPLSMDGTQSRRLTEQYIWSWITWKPKYSCLFKQATWHQTESSFSEATTSWLRSLWTAIGDGRSITLGIGPKRDIRVRKTLLLYSSAAIRKS